MCLQVASPLADLQMLQFLGPWAWSPPPPHTGAYCHGFPPCLWAESSHTCVSGPRRIHPAASLAPPQLPPSLPHLSERHHHHQGRSLVITLVLLLLTATPPPTPPVRPTAFPPNHMVSTHPAPSREQPLSPCIGPWRPNTLPLSLALSPPQNPKFSQPSALSST